MLEILHLKINKDKVVRLDDNGAEVAPYNFTKLSPQELKNRMTNDTSYDILLQDSINANLTKLTKAKYKEIYISMLLLKDRDVSSFYNKARVYSFLGYTFADVKKQLATINFAEFAEFDKVCSDNKVGDSLRLFVKFNNIEFIKDYVAFVKELEKPLGEVCMYEWVGAYDYKHRESYSNYMCLANEFYPFHRQDGAFAEFENKQSAFMFLKYKTFENFKNAVANNTIHLQ